MTSEPKSEIITLTDAQVRATMERFVEDLIRDHGDGQLSEEVLHQRLSSHDRVWIRRDLLPRIPDHPDIAWLAANEVSIAVKSSLDQFLVGKVRVQILKPEDRRRWTIWRDN